MKRSLCLLLCLLLVAQILSLDTIVRASGEDSPTGSRPEYVTVTGQTELIDALTREGQERVFIELGADIEGEQYYAFGPIGVKGYKTVDLKGHKIRSKLFFNDSSGDSSLFVVEAGAWLTINDSVGGGEIVRDRFIPAMGETNAYTDVFLSRPLTVFEVYGVLTVNAGEITAGHYESEYYSYTDGYIYSDSSPSPGTVNSVTPGNAVVVKDGGRFVSNGGEYYGRGFTIDDNGDKEEACAALRLCAGASADINAGDFYGKSCADVFSVDPGASICVFAGNFYARYDSRITVDKANGVATYVNVDCGRIGIPLYAFDHEKKDYTHIFVDSVEHYYDYADYSASDGEAFLNLGSSGTGIDVKVETMEGSGTGESPYLLTNAEDVGVVFRQSGSSEVFVRLMSDVDGCTGNYTVSGNLRLDLNGHKLEGKLGFSDSHETYAMFIVTGGSSLTVEDGAGGGEIVFDRRIPTMGETNEQTEIILDRPLTVFSVSGTLTVNAGEITAGHYESEYYTYTKKYNTGGSTSAGTVNSVTPGCAVVVRDGGRFVSNGGEYYGRGFTVDENGDKDFVCAAVQLRNGAVAVINDGEFYGKSNADVFSVAWGANAFVYAGVFNAQYDNRITVDKSGGVAYYVNVDCGRIGLPLRAFSHARSDRCRIRVDGAVYSFDPDFTSSQSDAFENIGADGTGATVTAEPFGNAVSQIEREDGLTAGLTYCPTDHFVLTHTGAAYFSDSFGELPGSLRTLTYYWKIARKNGSVWENVTFEYGTPAYSGGYRTAGASLDLYDLARAISGGMEHGATYRITACADEYWRRGDVLLYAGSGEAFELDCRYENLGNISLPDGVTGIQWPEHGRSPVNRTVEREGFTAELTFEERAAGGSRYVPMSGRSVFSLGGDYRLKVSITPKQFYLADAQRSVTVGGRTATDLALDGGVLTGYIGPLEVLPARLASVPVRGDLYEGVELSSASPLNSPVSGVTVSAVWYKNGAEFTGAAYYGEYRALVTVTAQDPYVFTDATVVKVFGTDYPIANLSSDGRSGTVLTDPRTVACSHRYNTGGYTSDSDFHYRFCSVCGEELSREAHSFGSWTHQGGEDVRECSVCGHVDSVSNGRSRAPYVRLSSAYPYHGDPLPSLAIYSGDAEYGTLEGAPEWYIDSVDSSNLIPSGTVMEAGHVYLAVVKIRANGGYYFDADTEVATYDLTASDTESVYASWGFLQATLSFAPSTAAWAEFVLGDVNGSQTLGDFMSGFSASVDGAASDFAISVNRNGSSLGSLIFNVGDSSWWIPSGSLGDFMATPMEADSDYRIQISVMDTNKYFDESRVTVLNPSAAVSYSVTAGDLGCTVTAMMHRGSGFIYGDANADGTVDTMDLTVLRQYLADPSSELAPGGDADADGTVDTVDLTLIRQYLADPSGTVLP